MARAYKSPHISLPAAMLSFLAGVTVAIAGAVPYAYFVTHMSIVYLNGVVCLVYSVLIGGAVGFTATGLKVANKYAAGLIGAAAAAVGLYLAWCTTRVVQVGRFVNGPVEFTLSPVAIYRFAAVYFEHGLWSLVRSQQEHGPAVKGLHLMIFWVLEAGTLISIGAGIPIRRIGHRTFCTKCRCWTSVEKDINRLAVECESRVKSALRLGNLATIANTPLADRKAHDYLRLDLATCPRCSESQFLTVVKRTVRWDKNRGEIKSEMTLGHLCLEPGEVAE